jgi:RNA-dependent RNA polymerase
MIPFESPPQFYIQAKAKEDIAKTFRPSDKIWIDWNTWYRQTEVVNRATRDNLEHEPLKHLKGAAIIDIGRWTAYRLSFDISTLTGPQFEEFSNALADYGVLIKDPAGYSLVQKSEPILWDSLQEEISTTRSDFESALGASAFAELSTRRVHISFPVQYQLEVCLSNGFLKEHKITRTFLERLALMDPTEATYILEKVADKQKIQEIVLYDPMNIFKVPIVGQLTKKVPSYCVLSRAVNITPTMMHVASPVVETSNRIIRKHATDADRFIRVKFSDEKTEGRVSQGDNRSDAIFTRVRRAMDEGIVIAGRFFVFFGLGN